MACIRVMMLIQLVTAMHTAHRNFLHVEINAREQNIFFICLHSLINTKDVR